MDKTKNAASWWDVAENHPLIESLSLDDSEALTRFLFWQVCSGDSERGRTLLSQLLLDWGFRSEHESFQLHQ